MTTKVLEPETRQEERLQPPRRWRNWVRIKRPTITYTYCLKCGELRFPIAVGDVIGTHCYTYPSQEVAELVAAKHLDPRDADYLGAYPDGERP